MSNRQRSSIRRDADAIARVREILWPRDDPERQWTPDTLDQIAEVVRKPARVSGADVRALYGETAVISRKGRFTLVHLDDPSPEVIRRRRREFDPATYFCPDCPLCELLKESGVIVFNESADGDDVSEV